MTAHSPAIISRISIGWLYQGNLHREVRDKDFRLTRIDYETTW